MRVLPANAQALGDRNEQQDSFAFSDHQDLDFLERAGFLAVLADGMGGMALGREAGDVAAQALLESYAIKEGEESVPDALRRSFERANRAVWELGRLSGCEDRVGTTTIAAVVFRGHLFWAHAGDSRLYLWRSGCLTQISRDHNLFQRLVGQGVAEDLAALEPQAEALTSFLGARTIPFLEVCPAPVELEPGDRIMLCTDGLYRGLEDREIARMLSCGPQQSAQGLVDEVLARKLPRQDNVTVLVLSIEEDRSEGAPEGRGLPGVFHPACLLAGLKRIWNMDKGGHQIWR